MNENNFHKEGDEAMIDTPQVLIDATITRVENFLKSHFPDYLNFENGTFTVNRGNSQVMIAIRPFTDTESCIEFASNVVYESKLTSELMQFLLRKNAELHFGAFGLLFDDTIIFQYTIAGSNVDSNELLTSINAVAIISAHYADEIVAMGAGKLINEYQDHS
ncbi:MAG: hypothetical protein CVV22_02055 [Ignavibacteriae bacterium HGW-Ignavibacteriae-1]|jgi:hypothetical protein|nr:MAG: hypothetical protein CVV22_02055 [Ignavibacteriae bacterium HGW-Ignavibacteriae-1]